MPQQKREVVDRLLYPSYRTLCQERYLPAREADHLYSVWLFALDAFYRKLQEEGEDSKPYVAINIDGTFSCTIQADGGIMRYGIVETATLVNVLAFGQEESNVTKGETEGDDKG